MAIKLDEAILDVLESKLAAITIANGHQQDVLKVSRALGPDAPMDFDLASEVPGLQIRQGATVSEPHLRGAIEHQMDVTIVCVAAYDATGATLSKLIADVCKVVNANKRWNDGVTNLARRTWLGDLLIHETETDESPVTARVPLTILFRSDATNPGAVKDI